VVCALSRTPGGAWHHRCPGGCAGPAVHCRRRVRRSRRSHIHPRVTGFGWPM